MFIRFKKYIKIMEMIKHMEKDFVREEFPLGSIFAILLMFVLTLNISL